MAGSLELEPTAALVMDWAKDLYRTGSAAAFCSHLDLSAGHRMRRECDEVCPWYPEVMMNRKWFIRHLASGMISAADGACQVVLIASGKSPLALELLEIHPGRIATVIETDIAGMEEKQQIYRAVAPEAAGKIRCVHADLYDPEGTAYAIEGTGVYDPDRPSVIVFEGISYYVPPAAASWGPLPFCLEIPEEHGHPRFAAPVPPGQGRPAIHLPGDLGHHPPGLQFQAHDHLQPG